QFYAVPMGTGFNVVSLAMPSELATASAIVVDNNELRAIADEQTGSARLVVGNILPADTSLVIVDHTFDVAPTPATFMLTVTQTQATPLAPSGMASAASTATNGGDLSRLALFSIDVAAANDTIGMQLAWSAAVIGQLYDGTGRAVATF